MRYKDRGEVHKDFHAATNMTIDYIVDNFGEDALAMLFRKMATDVYKSIHDKLKKGDASELIEHLKYYLDREKGEYEISENNGTIICEISKCPAVEHIIKSGLTLSPHFCRQTIEVNAGLCEGTPWKTKTELLGCGKCRQVFKLENQQ